MTNPDTSVDGITNLLAVGRRVLGEGSVIGQIADAFHGGRLDGADRRELRALNARAAELAEDLRVLRESASSVWSHIEGE